VKIWNPKCSKIRNFLNADMIPQMENSISNRAQSKHRCTKNI
jgi:hypothetical protein